jgi:hypothetical protein
MFDVKIMYMPNEKDDKNLVDETEYRKRQSQDIKVTGMLIEIRSISQYL